MVKNYQLISAATLAAWLALAGSSPALAQTAAPTADISGIANFIRAIINALAALAGLAATGFFVIGGLSYITSSGNPLALERAKRTILFAGFGLAITIAAFWLAGLIGDLGAKTLV